LEARLFKLIFTVVLIVGLYYFIVEFGDFGGDDAAIVITAFAALYGLFMIGFFLRDGR
jgi:hypothetical protein